MQLSFTETARKSLKWYKKLFFHLLDVTIYNCYVLYKLTKKESLQFSNFCLVLVKDLCARYGEATKSSGRPGANHHDRLTERHFPSLIPESKQRQCYVCNNTNMKPRQKTKRTRYECRFCNKGLCIAPCFEEYHTLSNF